MDLDYIKEVLFQEITFELLVLMVLTLKLVAVLTVKILAKSVGLNFKKRIGYLMVFSDFIMLLVQKLFQFKMNRIKFSMIFKAFGKFLKISYF